MAKRPRPPKKGSTFGLITITGSKIQNGRLFWIGVCDCGKEVARPPTRMLISKSCGCDIRVKHGSCETPEYEIWLAMRYRCRHHPNYAGRGIRIDPRWNDFKNFLQDVGPRPDKKLMLERIDNDGNYEPGNVVWATRKIQNRNQRRTIRITHNGITKSCADWADEIGMSPATLRKRITNHGWSAQRAIEAIVKPGCPTTKEQSKWKKC